MKKSFLGVNATWKQPFAEFFYKWNVDVWLSHFNIYNMSQCYVLCWHRGESKMTRLSQKQPSKRFDGLKKAQLDASSEEDFINF